MNANEIETYSCDDRERALDTFRGELRGFSYDGLVALAIDLSENNVATGTWAGCPLSYARGERGSTRRTSTGEARNVFTVCWDNGWIGREAVLRCVFQELQRRSDLFSQAPALRDRIQVIESLLAEVRSMV